MRSTYIEYAGAGGVAEGRAHGSVTVARHVACVAWKVMRPLVVARKHPVAEWSANISGLQDRPAPLRQNNTGRFGFCERTGCAHKVHFGRSVGEAPRRLAVGLRESVLGVLNEAGVALSKRPPGLDATALTILSCTAHF
eukprot:SAG31_NODE_1351_length_8676_cov_3.112044_3_plen_139_part_00